MKLSLFLPIMMIALFSLAIGLFLGSEIGISFAHIITKEYVEIEVEMTAYSPSKHITQGDPFRTASNLKVTPQNLEQLEIVALSRDLIEKYGLEWGDIVYIGFELQDTMAAKVTNTVDLFMRNLDLARKLGRQERRIIVERRE